MSGKKGQKHYDQSTKWGHQCERLAENMGSADMQYKVGVDCVRKLTYGKKCPDEKGVRGKER